MAKETIQVRKKRNEYLRAVARVERARMKLESEKGIRDTLLVELTQLTNFRTPLNENERALAKDNPIQAIKAYRERRGMDGVGLKEAKDVVDEYRAAKGYTFKPWGGA